MNLLFQISQSMLERGLLPDAVLRAGGRELLRRKLAEESKGGPTEQKKRQESLVNRLKHGPIAVATDKANEQHYELPTAFFRRVLGRHLKYSSGYWEAGVHGIDASEERMLALTCQRAGLADGQDILELGCGWGSLSLYMAEHYPNSRITAVSNSRTQRESIEADARARGSLNLQVLTADMRTFEAPETYDRIVSVEMLEHMRNYELLFEKIARWMRPEARFFVHIFSHVKYAYLYDEKDETDWIARYFFTGGTMPSHELFRSFDRDLRVERDWRVEGTHYQKTCEAWLRRMDSSKAELWPLFESTYGAAAARKWWSYWRTFFIACAELFGFAGGTEWGVSHYLLRKR